MAQGPLFTIDRVDVGPDDLLAQLPVRAQLVRVIPGPDRPDYVLAVAQTPIRHRTTLDHLRSQGIDPATADPRMFRANEDGSVDLLVYGLVLAARIAGQQIHPGMADFPVMLAYVVDNTLMGDESMDFKKALYAAVAFITEHGVPDE